MSTAPTTSTATQPEGNGLTGWQPWLVHLNDPSKLTPEQRVACGIDAAFTCNVRSKRKNCQQLLGAVSKANRDRCEQFARIPPPPADSLPATNPSTSPGGSDAAASHDMLALADAVSRIEGALGTLPVSAPASFEPPGGEGFVHVPPGLQLVEGPEDDGTPFGLGVPLWVWVAGAAALLVWGTR